MARRTGDAANTADPPAEDTPAETSPYKLVSPESARVDDLEIAQGDVVDLTTDQHDRLKAAGVKLTAADQG